MYKFKYHPDNNIYINGTKDSSFSDFITANPDFPIVESNFFELIDDDTLSFIDSSGHHTDANASSYPNLIEAINTLID